MKCDKQQFVVENAPRTNPRDRANPPTRVRISSTPIEGLNSVVQELTNATCNAHNKRVSQEEYRVVKSPNKARYHPFPGAASPGIFGRIA